MDLYRHLSLQTQSVERIQRSPGLLRQSHLETNQIDLINYCKLADIRIINQSPWDNWLTIDVGIG